MRGGTVAAGKGAEWRHANMNLVDDGGLILKPYIHVLDRLRDCFKEAVQQLDAKISNIPFNLELKESQRCDCYVLGSSLPLISI